MEFGILTSRTHGNPNCLRTGDDDFCVTARGHIADKFFRIIAGTGTHPTVFRRAVLSLRFSGDFGGAARTGCGRRFCLPLAELAVALWDPPSRLDALHH